MKVSFLSIIFLMLLLGCSSRPQLYPNKHFKKMGRDQANSDIQLCMNEANEYVESSKGKKVAKGAGAGALIGGAMGAVGGALTGNLARGALVGGAVGAAGGGTAAALSPDQMKRKYVNTCLSEQGYKVLGWD